MQSRLNQRIYQEAEEGERRNIGDNLCTVNEIAKTPLFGA